MRQTCILVLGMHRSGTSALTGVLSMLDIYLGSDLMQPTKDNEKGYFEHNQFYKINEKLLSALNSSWDDVFFNINKLQASIDVTELQVMIEKEFKYSKSFAIKDPRLTYLFPCYTKALQALNVDVKVIIPYRNPYEVASSLQKRDGFSLEKGMLLWAYSILLAEKLSRNYLRSFVNFDELLVRPREVIENISEEIELDLISKYDEKLIGAFLERGMKHHNISVDNLSKNIPIIVQKIIGLLKKLDDDACQEFDYLYQEVFSYQELFYHSDLLRIYNLPKELNERLFENEKSLETSQQQLNATKEILQAKEAQLGTAQQQLNATKETLQAKEAQLGTAQQQLNATKETLQAKEAMLVLQIKNLDDTLEQLKNNEEMLLESSLKVQELECVLEENRDKYDSLSFEYSMLQKQNSEKERIVMNVTTILQQEKKELENQLESLRENFSRLQQDSYALQRSKEQLEEECKKELFKLEGERQYSAAEVIGKKAEIEKLLNDISILNNAMADKDFALESIMSSRGWRVLVRYYKIRKHLLGLDPHYKTLIEAKGSDFKRLSDKVYESINQSLYTEIDHVNTVNTMLNAQVESLGKEINILHAEFNHVKTTNVTLHTEIDQINSTNTILHGQIESLKQEAKAFFEFTFGQNNKIDERSVEYTEYSTKQTIKTDIRLIAFYLPQFHPLAVNDKAWGKGFTEWTNVTKAVPQFEDHYQPRLPGELGFYDLRLMDVQKRQIELAKNYGLHGFCYHYYWFAGKKIMDRPLQQVLDNSELDFPFCINWANENWTKRWDGLDQEVILQQEHSAKDDMAFLEAVKPILTDKRYIKINGKCLLMVYRPQLFPDIKSTVKRWREHAKRIGIGELYLVLSHSFDHMDPRSIDFDAATEFAPNNFQVDNLTANVKKYNSDYEGYIFDYKSAINYSIGMEKTEYTKFRSLCPSWDNEARKPGKGVSFINASPEAYSKWLEYLLYDTEQNRAGDEKIIFINAWNEWAEGAYLEPDRKYGYAYLERTYKQLKKFENNRLELLTKTQKRGKESDTAIVLHLYYMDVWGEIKNELKNFQDKYDLYINVNNNASIDEIQKIIQDCPTARLFSYENRGRDIYPFIQTLNVILPLEYKYVCKIHSKKSLHRVDGDQWRNHLIKSLIGSQEIISKAKKMLDNNSGIVVAKDNIYPFKKWMGSNQEMVRSFATKSNIKFSKAFSFPAGSMFWFNPSIMNKLVEYFEESLMSFEDEQIDGTKAHAVERIFGLLCLDSQMSIDEI